MNSLNLMRNAVCVAALFVGGAAHADVTAADVWADWKSQMAFGGANTVVTGVEEQTGGTLTVNDITVSMDDGNVEFTSNLGSMTLEEQGDGTVRVTVPESYPISMTFDGDGTVNLLVSQSGLEMIVSGTADALDYDYSAQSVSISLDNIVDGDVTINADASIKMSDLTGQSTSRPGDVREITSTLAVASTDFLLDFQAPGSEGEYVVASGKVEGLDFDGKVSLPDDADFENPDDLFAMGFASEGVFSVDSAAYIFDINADGDQATGSVSNGASTFSSQISIDALAYATQTENLALNMTSGDFPFPVEIAMSQIGFGLNMPTGQSDEASPFSLNIDLVDLVINDMIWDLLDGGRVLPRDPATLQIGVSGTARPLVDIMDPTQSAALVGGQLPYELGDLTIDTLNVTAVGAEITGDGAFTFDNTDLETFDGMPRPEGNASVQVNGLNKLMDNLVSMGLIPEDQIMGGRMMLGMFARTVGDDQLETTLEVNGEGHVLVNGQRMR
ncbi:DUF2125 domain-containing protein [Yoonia sediminilitoris]|uniref:Uncharacterized protein DUF2125 n=1 Tax=Yoonia sediminilitoris TaxID=1286148 RepID=A0A2T6K9W0_9RHOB|nr:DUF2125 domain-containing protein [Yoonia sediminilitoris]PUB11592.1 uncharacterized protein DUF2125 [Yoonia sediminilitoris]RCW91792.1 uncharacterized protein DUF2125 [Yoonia sediminilitoris]